MNSADAKVADQGVGTPGFVERHGLHTDEQREAAQRVITVIRKHDLRTVRVVIVDQHGIPRAKFLSAEAAVAAMSNGADFSGAIYSLDTANSVFPQAFAAGGGFGIEEFTGFPDVVIVPDPSTFRVLPWADRTGWILCDVYFSNGRPVPLDGRAIMREQLRRLHEAGYGYTAGLEVEFYIVRLVSERIALDQTGAPPPPPVVDVFEQGYQFLSETRLDRLEETLRALRDGLYEVGVPPRSMEDEWGPGQMEFTVAPLDGLAPADAMIMFRTAIKSICRRRGLLATFMCWPALPNFFPSGWHLHELLTAAGSAANAFASRDGDAVRGGPAVRRRSPRTRPADDHLHHANGQRLWAIPAVLVRARSGRLGPREPRDDGARAGRSRRHGHAHREPSRRAGGQPVPLHGGEHRCGPGRAQPRSGAAAAGHV